MRRVVGVVLAAVIGAGCSGSAEWRITPDELADPEVDISAATGIVIPDEVTDQFSLGDMCTSIGEVPLRWFQDALVPIQLAVDTFAEVDAPAELDADVATLVTYGRDRLRWSFQGGDRPIWADEQENAERRLAEWAEANCDLPPIIGPFDSGVPPAWENDSPEQIAANCDEERARTIEAVDEFEARFGRTPAHAIVLETHSELFWSSDYYHLEPDGQVVAVAGGVCDR